MRIVLLLVSLVLAPLVTVAPGGQANVVHAQQPPAPQPAGGPPAALVERARQDLARRLGMSASQVSVAESTAMTWSSLALGCPAPGMAYAAVETPGFLLLLDVYGQRYTYHTDTRETFVPCIQGQAAPDAQVLSASGLLAALLERGVRVEVADAYAELPFLRADGTRYRLSGGGLADAVEIQVYDYRDPTMLLEDAARIGPDGQPIGGRVEWSRTPLYFRSGSVLALTFESAQPLIEMLTDLLGPPFAGTSTSGAPQPPSSLPPIGPPPAPSPVTGPPGPPSSLPSSMPPTDPAVPRVSWDEAKALVAAGKVQQAFQTHALEVRLYLKEGGSVVTTETRIDEIFQVIRDCGASCADVMIATE